MKTFLFFSPVLIYASYSETGSFGQKQNVQNLVKAKIKKKLITFLQRFNLPSPVCKN